MSKLPTPEKYPVAPEPRCKEKFSTAVENEKGEVVATASSISAKTLLLVAEGEEQIFATIEGEISFNSLAWSTGSVADLIKKFIGEVDTEDADAAMLEMFSRRITNSSEEQLSLLWKVLFSLAVQERIASGGISPRIFERIRKELKAAQEAVTPAWEICLVEREGKISAKRIGKMNGTSAAVAAYSFGKQLAEMKELLESDGLPGGEIFINAFNAGIENKVFGSEREV